jgi:hypothetical protein
LRAPRQNKVDFADDGMFQVAIMPLPEGNMLFNMLELS